VEGRAAWYSLAFLLRTAAVASLDVDVQELSAGFRTIPGQFGPVGQVFLSDSLENGAGYCRWLSEHDNFLEILSRLAVSPAGESAALLLGVHASECDASCNRCLRDYYNLPYHGVLDWRLGLEMARLLASQSTQFDLSSSWEKNQNPWLCLFDGQQSPVTASLRQLGYDPAPEIAGLRVYVSEHRRIVLVLRHPLWTDAHLSLVAAKQAAGIQYPGYTIGNINPFRAIRRIIDYI
jgi:hypothetical protein